jgi:hypothetical protein
MIAQSLSNVNEKYYGAFQKKIRNEKCYRAFQKKFRK